MKHLYTNLKVVLVALFAMTGINAMAGEVLKLNFAELTPISEAGICTYAKDMETNGTKLSQMQEINGWFMAVENGDARAGGIFAYGSSNWLGGTGYVAPAVGPEGETVGNALGLVAVWSGTVCYQRSATLPAGNYKMKIRLYNSVGGSSVPEKSLFGFVAEGGVEYLAGAKAYPIGEWTTEEISFTLDKETNGEISLGYASKNVGSSNAQHLFVHDVVIESITAADVSRQDLKKELDIANALLENTDKVGEGLFLAPQSAWDELHAAVFRSTSVYNDETATEDELKAAIQVVKDAVAAYNKATTLPSAIMAYTFKQKASGLYMALTGEGDAAQVVLSENPYKLKFEYADGGFYLTDGTRYVGVTGANAWSMTAAPDKKALVNGTNLGNGEYTFEITGYRSIGSDDPVDGAQLWADKYVGRENYDSDRCIWTLDEVIPDNMTVINVQRQVGLGYGVTAFTPDFTDALHLLGIGDVSEAKVVGLNPDGTEEAAPGPGGIDGWCNKDGYFCGWNSNSKICVKMFPSVPQYEICDMNGADVVGAVYTVCYGLKANDKMAVMAIKVQFIPQDYKTFPIVKTIEVTHHEMANTAYSEVEPAPTFDVEAVSKALGLNDLNDPTTYELYIVNVTDGNFVENTTDGWRNGDGDAAPWNYDAKRYFCVKLNYPASGEFDYTGAISDDFNIGDTFLAQWAIVANEKAVLLKVNVVFDDPAGINDITVDEKASKVYNLNGMLLKNGAQQKGIYIVNGKKVVIK